MQSAGKLEAWKIFLQGRIAQENGDEEGALRSFARAVQLDPTNASFTNSKAIALRNLHRPEEAAAERIAASYRALASAHTGADDKPAAWLAGLHDLLKEAETIDAKAIGARATVVW